MSNLKSASGIVQYNESFRLIGIGTTEMVSGHGFRASM